MLRITDEQPLVIYNARHGRIILVLLVMAKRCVTGIELSTIKIDDVAHFAIKWPVQQLAKVVPIECTEGDHHWMVLPVARAFLRPDHASSLRVSSIAYTMAGTPISFLQVAATECFVGCHSQALTDYFEQHPALGHPTTLHEQVAVILHAYKGL